MRAPGEAHALEGVGVLVTRPESDAGALCRLLEARGASTVRLAAIEIRATADGREAAQRRGALDGFDLIVFTSANAARFGAPLLARRHDLALAAIGPATARALHDAGHRVALLPASRFDSEGLLELPELHAPAGRRVLIVKGRGGRGLLEPSLVARGADVATLEVYERLPARPSPAVMDLVGESLQTGAIRAVTATSLDIAARLLELEHPLLRKGLEGVHWLVPGARVAAGVRELGVRAPLIEARSAEDQALVSALVAWRAAGSGGRTSGA